MPLLARAAKLFTCYKARCQEDRGVWRLYFGLTRVDAAQTAEGLRFLQMLLAHVSGGSSGR